MILKLIIECIEGRYWEEPCIRVLEIDEEASLFDLHEAIQKAVSFDRDHLFGFYIANSSSHLAVKHWLRANEGWEGEEIDCADISLREVYPLGRKKLYYLFDYGDSWLFEIKKARGVKDPEPGVTYPRVVEAIGPAPEQYPSWGE